MRKFSGNIIDLTPQTHKIMDANEYLVFISKQREQIKSSKFVIPKIGSDNFGMFEVELNNPFFELADN